MWSSFKKNGFATVLSWNAHLFELVNSNSAYIDKTIAPRHRQVLLNEDAKFKGYEDRKHYGMDLCDAFFAGVDFAEKTHGIIKA